MLQAWHIQARKNKEQFLGCFLNHHQQGWEAVRKCPTTKEIFHKYSKDSTCNQQRGRGQGRGRVRDQGKGRRLGGMWVPGSELEKAMG